MINDCQPPSPGQAAIIQPAQMAPHSPPKGFRLPKLTSLPVWQRLLRVFCTFVYVLSKIVSDNLLGILETEMTRYRRLIPKNTCQLVIPRPRWPLYVIPVG